MKSLEEKNLSEISSQIDKDKYFNELKLLKSNRISKEIVDNMSGESIINIYNKIRDLELKYTSDILFPGDLVSLHGGIKEVKALKERTCDFSGGIIRKGSFYINYRPLIENISKNTSYVLNKTINVESGYYYDLPETIVELESLYLKMKNCPDNEIGIDYSHFNQRMGGEFVLTKLKRSR
jgi:hypothetical protein